MVGCRSHLIYGRQDLLDILDSLHIAPGHIGLVFVLTPSTLLTDYLVPHLRGLDVKKGSEGTEAFYLQITFFCQLMGSGSLPSLSTYNFPTWMWSANGAW